MDAVAFKFLSVGLMGIALAGTAIGVGKIFAAALDGIARNPSAEKKLQNMFMLVLEWRKLWACLLLCWHFY